MQCAAHHWGATIHAPIRRHQTSIRTLSLNKIKMAEECDPRVLLDLYNRADRLRPLLDGARGGSRSRDSPFAEGHGRGTGSATGDDEGASLEVNKAPERMTRCGC